MIVLMKFIPEFTRRSGLTAWKIIAIAVVMTLPAMASAEQGAPRAESTRTPRVFLMPTDSVRDEVTAIVTERVGESLRERLQGEGRIDLLPRWAEFERRQQAGNQSSAAIAEAERLYTSGIGLLTAGENQRAAETFQRAVDLMEQHIADLYNFEILVDALSNLSLAYFLAGFDLDARQSMQRFVHLRPKAKLDEEKFPKELRDLFRDEQNRVERAGNGKLVISASVAGAQVYIDGQLKGEAPVTVEDIGFGHHYLVVRDARGNTWSEQIRVRGRGAEQNFEVNLGDASVPAVEASRSTEGFFTDLRAAFKTGQFGEELHPYFTELASRTRTEYVVWIVLVRDRNAYVAHPFVYRIADRKMASLEDVRFNMELSNLRVGVNRASDDIVKAIVTMPEEMIVSAVSIGTPVEASRPSQTVVAQGEPTQAAEQQPLPVPRASVADDEIIAAPARMPSETRANPWRYAAWGGAAVLVGGAIAGSVYLLTQSDSPTKAAGFEAEVKW
jgi:hypothetical protein